MDEKQKLNKYLLFLKDLAVYANQKESLSINVVLKEVGHFQKQIDSFKIESSLKELLRDQVHLKFSKRRKNNLVFLNILVVGFLGPRFSRSTYDSFETDYLRKILTNFVQNLEYLMSENPI